MFPSQGYRAEQRGDKQVLKYGPQVPGGVLQSCLVHNLTGLGRECISPESWSCSTATGQIGACGLKYGLCVR